MQVQTSGNNDTTSFKNIISYSVKGKDFRRNPKLAQKIIDKMKANNNFAYPDRIMKATIRSIDTMSISDLTSIMGYSCFEKPDVLRCPDCYAWIFLRERPNGNVFERMWKYIKAAFSFEGSQNKYEVEPYKLDGCDTNIVGAVDNLIKKIDMGFIPEK